MEFFKKLFETDFMPHGHCYFWKPAVLWTNVLGDAFIALSYFIIPVLLVKFLKKRRDVRFRGLFLAFAAFILACGLTHVIDIVSVWHPVYRLEGLVKVITALASVGTVAGLFYTFPTILKLPTPEQWALAKQEVKRSENRFRLVMEQAPIGVAITGSNGDFLEVNDTVCQMFNYPGEQLKTMNFRHVTHPDDMGISLNVQNDLQSKLKQFIQLEKRYLRSDGSFFWAMVSATALPEEQCNLVHIVDITERKQLEERMQMDNRFLEAKVRERTVALEETNRDLENFIYAVTHDLRVPLNNLAGLTTALGEELEALQNESEAKYILDMIHQNARRMDELVVDLLAFSRTGRQELYFGQVDMTAIFSEVFDELKNAYAHKEIIFDLPALPPAFGDEAALRQICLNLLSNALKYSSQKTVVHVRVTGWEEGNKTCYSVADNGTGYDNRYADKLFKLFQRLHNAEDYEGTGLGLATSFRLVEKHGGHMWSESVLGEGATFFFCIPKQ